MPKSTFSTTNVRSSGTSFPQLKLEKAGDHARIKLAEADPTYEWVHTLRKMKLSPVTGQPMMTTRKFGKGDDAEEREVYDLDFVGTPICFGNDDILTDRGIDPDHCPICKATLDYTDLIDCIGRPERKWAVHVFRYATQGNGTKPITPLSVEVRVWRMSDNRYARVVGVLEEFAPQVDGDPLRVDLTLGPCVNAKFQNYEIQGSPRCALAASPADWDRAQQIFEANHVDDLSPYCGRKSDIKFVKNDLEEIIGKWRAAQQGGAKVEEPDFAGTLSSSMLDTAPAATAPKQEAPSASLDELDSTVGGSSEESEEEATPAVTVPATPQTGGVQSFASLMESIGVQKN